MKKLIDARNLPCPQPLMLVKKAIDTGDPDVVEITVNSSAAKENILKYVNYVKLEVTNIIESGEEYIISISTGKPEKEPAPAHSVVENQADGCPMDERPMGKIIFFNADKIGNKNPELGELLMKGFIYTLAELENKPGVLIFMNDGIRLTVEGSDSIGNLKKLEKSGVDILVCGTCLEYLKLQDKLKVGRVSNMYDITEKLMNSKQVMTI